MIARGATYWRARPADAGAWGLCTWVLGAALVLAPAAAVAQGSEAAPSERLDCPGLYERGDYVEAARCFGALESTGQLNGHVLYNQGNSWMRSGDVGRAVHAYRRARLFLPRNGDLLANLKTAREQSKDALGFADDRSPLARAILAPYDALSGSELLLVGASIWALFFLGYALRIGRGHLQPGGALSCALLLALLSLSGYAARSYQLSEHPVAVVLDEEVTLRSGRDLRSVDLARLHAGAEARIVEETAAWVQVRLAGGQRGWLPADSVGLVRPEIDAKGVLP